MGEDTGNPDKPYVGKRGPRKTPPPGAKKKRPEDKVVTELFTEERQKADHRFPDGRKTKRRAKVKLGQGWTRALDRIKEEDITMADFVKELSPEELARGRLRNADGTFSGGAAQWVPAEFHKECIRELMRRGKELYQINYIEAIKAMTTIATTPSVDTAQRIKAAQFVIERIEGKVPERLEVGVSEPWQELLTGIVATVEPGTPMRAFNEAAKEPEED